MKNASSKVGRKTSKKEREHLVDISLSRGQEKKKNICSSKVNVQMRKDRLQKPLNVEPIVKEEGEMSDDDDVYEQFKEGKWMEWCQNVMVEEMKTLKRLHRLQTTSASLPKEKVPILLCSILLCFFPISNVENTIYSLSSSTLGAFKNPELLAASWAKDRSNCLRTGRRTP